MRTTTAAFFRSSHFISATAAGEYQNCHQQKKPDILLSSS
jgi:hypothetical protein